jgi:hypothetical protein
MNDCFIFDRPTALEAILRETANVGFSMPSEPQTGSFLRTLAASKPAGRFLELGTGTGVATAWLLAGMDHASRSCSMPICAAGHIAAALARRNIPFVFVTGYGREALPESFGQSSMLTKPFTQEQLVEAATQLIRPPRPSLASHGPLVESDTGDEEVTRIGSAPHADFCSIFPQIIGPLSRSRVCPSPRPSSAVRPLVARAQVAKWDGFRFQVFKDGSDVRFFSKARNTATLVRHGKENGPQRFRRPVGKRREARSWETSRRRRCDDVQLPEHLQYTMSRFGAALG